MFYKTEDVCAYINKATYGLSGIAKCLMQRTEIWQWRCLIQVNDYYAVSAFAIEYERRSVVRDPVGSGCNIT